jgi:hypothetical protein
MRRVKSLQRCEPVTRWLGFLESIAFKDKASRKTGTSESRGCRLHQTPDGSDPHFHDWPQGDSYSSEERARQLEIQTVA